MLSQERIREIISFVEDLKKQRHTNDPYQIAAMYGIKITELDSCYKDFTAQTIAMPGYPILIWINGSYTYYSKRVLCAHELGHAFFHTSKVCNHFAQGAASLYTDEEHEANLFAVALLTNASIYNKLDFSLEIMDNNTLKSILDYNLSFKV